MNKGEIEGRRSARFQNEKQERTDGGNHLVLLRLDAQVLHLVLFEFK